MNNRLKEFIEYKTGGKQTEFCALLGWTPPYLSKLLKGVNFGIQPVIKLLSTCPELNARWLLCGTGTMLNEERYNAVRREMLEAVTAVLDAERYMPVMSAEELHDFEQFITTGRKPDFSPDTVNEWERRLCDREKEMEARFAAAKQTSVCRQKKAKK